MTKKPVKKVAAKAAAKPMPKAVAPVVPADCCKSSCCGGGCSCGCKCGGFWRFVKKLIIFVIIFALGFAACKFICSHNKGWKMKQFAFVDGCLDMSKIKCPMMAQKVMAADVDNDGCITKEELVAWKKAKFANRVAEGVEEVEEMCD